jgi:two-component system, chemotaxis family, chemotaxis protein CheY
MKMTVFQRTALVVDDSAAMRKQLARALQRIGVGAVEATDGADAWRRLHATAVDIILTDVNMPVMDGLKLVGLVRAGGRHQATPIVVITTESADEDRRRALSAGASGYLVKPVQSQEVMQLVETLLRARAACA